MVRRLGFPLVTSHLRVVHRFLQTSFSSTCADVWTQPVLTGSTGEGDDSVLVLPSSSSSDQQIVAPLLACPEGLTCLVLHLKGFFHALAELDQVAEALRSIPFSLPYC